MRSVVAGEGDYVCSIIDYICSHRYYVCSHTYYICSHAACEAVACAAVVVGVAQFQAAFGDRAEASPIAIAALIDLVDEHLRRGVPLVGDDAVVGVRNGVAVSF